MLFQDLPENSKVIFRDLFMTIFSKYVADTDTVEAVAEKLKDLERHYRCTEELEDTIYSLEEEVSFLKDELQEARAGQETAIEELERLKRKMESTKRALQNLE